MAPINPVLYIAEAEAIKPYERIKQAVGMVESSNGLFLYNHIEEATGYFQIRPIRLYDYNKRTGSNYKLKDLYDYEVSEKIFMYYAEKIGYQNYEKIAKDWNGSGPKTINYWKLVKSHL